MLALVKNGSGDTRLSQLTQRNEIALLRRSVGEPNVRSGDAALVDISLEARHLHRVGVLAQPGNELRAEKVSRVKEQIVQGTYYVDPIEIAKAVMRSEITRLLGRE